MFSTNLPPPRGNGTDSPRISRTSNRSTASTHTERFALNYHLYSYPPGVVPRVSDGPVLRPISWSLCMTPPDFRLMHQAAFGATDRDVRGEQGAGASVIRLGVLDSRGEREWVVWVRKCAFEQAPQRCRAQGCETRNGSLHAKDSQHPPHAARAGTPANPCSVVRVRLAVWCGVAPVRGVDCPVGGGAPRLGQCGQGRRASQRRESVRSKCTHEPAGMSALIFRAPGAHLPYLSGTGTRPKRRRAGKVSRARVSTSTSSFYFMYPSNTSSPPHAERLDHLNNNERRVQKSG
ncbi:hypothetical protein FB451DRAFT_1401453 [Mycena latifolia]|nr:hypothetical protein FB451DRAFT_1401453 [Mycena latifolia]